MFKFIRAYVAWRKIGTGRIKALHMAWLVYGIGGYGK